MTVDRAFGLSREDRGGLRRMLVLSLLLHAFALSLFFVCVPKASSPKLTFGPDYAVSLVSSADLRMDGGNSSRELAKELADLPEAEPAPAAPPKPEEKVSRSEPASLSPVPVRKVEPMKRQDGALGKAIEEIRRRVESAGQKQASAPAYPGGGITSDSPIGGSPAGAVGDAELGARMKAYYGSIWMRIKRHWSMPPDLLPRQNIEAVIHVRILRSGAVEGISFEQRSGNSYFDESAMRAVRKASPFPPLPEGTGEEGIEMGIRFHSSELR